MCTITALQYVHNLHCPFWGRTKNPVCRGVTPSATRPHSVLQRRSRSSAVMHVTPELEVLGSNPGGVGTQCPRRKGVCDPASRKGCCEGQVGITVTLEFGVRPSTLP